MSRRGNFFLVLGAAVPTAKVVGNGGLLAPVKFFDAQYCWKCNFAIFFRPRQYEFSNAVFDTHCASVSIPLYSIRKIATCVQFRENERAVHQSRQERQGHGCSQCGSNPGLAAPMLNSVIEASCRQRAQPRILCFASTSSST